MSNKVKLLTNLKVREVSGVDYPANQGAKVLLTKMGKQQEQNDMNPKELADAIAKGLEPMKADVAKAQALALLSDVEKVQYATLKADDQAKFLSLQGEARTKAFPPAADEDDEEAKAKKKAGKKTEKSAEELELAKSAERVSKAEARVEALEKAAAQEKLEKRATTELADVAATTVQKVDLLKACDAMGAEAGKAVLDLVKGAGVLSAKLTKMLGNNGSVGADTPLAKLNKMADEHKAVNKNMTREQAFAAVIKTAEGGELYAQTPEGGQASA